MADEADLILAENRRLRRENRALEERIAAFEASRWWRLHPRSLLSRAAPVDHAESLPVDVLDESAGVSTEGVTTAFRQEVAERLTVSRDSFTDRVELLDPLVAPLQGRRARVLEIGSFEGMSACYFLWRLPDSHVTCIDTFLGGIDDRAAATHAGLEDVFDRNVAVVDASRVAKIVDDSRAALLDLQSRRAEFDLVYVDGSHLALDVLVDGALSWRITAAGGIVIFDDYRWNDAGDDPLLRPGPAIDALLQLLAGKYELLDAAAQVAIRKVEPG